MHIRKVKAGGVNATIDDFVGEKGIIFYDQETGRLRLSDGHTPGGVEIYPSAGVLLDSEPPVTTTTDLLWYDTESGRLYVYYDDNWVDANPQIDTGLNLAAVTHSIIPAENLAYDLGSADHQWRSLYIGTDTIYIGGIGLGTRGGGLSFNGNPVPVVINGQLTSGTGTNVSSGFATTSTLINGVYTVRLDLDGNINLPGRLISDNDITLAAGTTVLKIGIDGNLTVNDAPIRFNTSTLVSSAVTSQYAQSFNTTTLVTRSVNANLASQATYAQTFNTATLVANAVNASTAVYAQTFNTATLVANAVNASTAVYAQTFNTATLVANAVNASTAVYAQTFNTSTLVANAVNAAYAQTFNTATLVANAVHAGTADYAQTFNTATLVTVASTLVSGSNLTLKDLLVTGDATFQGQIIITNTTTHITSTNTVYTNNLVELHTPESGPLGQWAYDDGLDIGIKIHYYATQSKRAALFLSNTTGNLEWMSSSSENQGHFTGTYGTFKTGAIQLVNPSNTLKFSDGSVQVTAWLGTSTLMSTAVTATYAQSFNTSTLVTNAVNAQVAITATNFNTATLVTNAVNATTATYARTFNTATLVANSVNAVTATYAQSFNTATLVATAVNVINGSQTFNTSTLVAQAVCAGYANSFNTATLVTKAVSAVNLAGGSPGAIPYQTSSTTAYLSLGTAGYVLQSNGSTAQWVSTSSLGISGGTGGGVAGVSSITAGTGTAISGSTGDITIWSTVVSSGGVSTATVSLDSNYSLNISQYNRLPYTTNRNVLTKVVWSPTNSRFVAVGYTTGTVAVISYSSDGISWFNAYTGSTSTVLTSITISSLGFLAVGYNNFSSKALAIRSTSGLAWTPVDVSAEVTGSPKFYDVTWTGSKYVAVGTLYKYSDFSTYGLIMTSSDGITWTRQGVGNTSVDSTLYWFYGVGAASSSSIVAFAGANYSAPNPGIVSSSDNGTTWTSRDSTISSSTRITAWGVIWSGAQYVAIGSISGQGGNFDTNLVLTSSNGTTWSRQSSSFGNGTRKNESYGIAFSGTKYVMVGRFGFTGPLDAYQEGPDVWTSVDAITWSQQQIPNILSMLSAQWYSVTWSSSLSLFLVVGYDSTEGQAMVYSSPDGITWTRKETVTPVSTTTNITIGFGAGTEPINKDTIAIGTRAGVAGVGLGSIAIGRGTGKSQSYYTLSIGYNSGANLQARGIAVGYYATPSGNGQDSIAVGSYAIGNPAITTGTNTIAIGSYAAYWGQNSYSIAIGYKAGYSPSTFVTQPTKSIVLNASGDKLAGVDSGFVVNPIRQTTSSLINAVLTWNSINSEIAYVDNIKLTGSIDAGSFLQNGVPFTGGGGSVYSNTNVASFLGTGPNITATNIVVLGNLQVLGTFTSLSTSSLSISTLTVTLASGAVNGSQANGAGINVAGANATMTYVNTSDSWVFNKSISTPGTLTAGGVVFTTATFTNLVITGTVSASDYLYTGVGPVNIVSNNDLNFQATGWITFNSVPKLPNYSRTELLAYSNPPKGGLAFNTSTSMPVYYNGSTWTYIYNNLMI